MGKIPEIEIGWEKQLVFKKKFEWYCNIKRCMENIRKEELPMASTFPLKTKWEHDAFNDWLHLDQLLVLGAYLSRWQISNATT